MPFVTYIFVAIVSYLLGSLPTGFLLARARGVDIFKAGSGNMGATNVFRVLGKPAGIFVLLVDFGKGLAACRLVPMLFGYPDNVVLMIVAGICSILGHNYTCWLRFRGGKGIATSAGVIVGLVPVAFGIVLLVWVITAFVTRYVSVASIASAVALPITVWALGRDGVLIGVSVFMSAVAIYKHRGNIRRLMDGTEHRFGSGKEKNSGKASE